jgi:hypothetical protein
MLEDIALSISTLFFVICNIFISGFAPAVPADKNNPTAPLETSIPSNAVACSVDDIEEFAIVGVWESFGYTYEFTESGKLILDSETFRYSVEGNTVTILGKDAAIKTMKLEPLNSRAMKLNGMLLYKIN